MDIRRYITRRNIILSTVGVVVIVIAFILIDNLYFRLKSTSPAMDKFADSSVQISFHFSQPIESIGSVEINDREVGNVAVDGSIVTVPIDIELEKGKTYSVVIRAIESKWFGNKIESIQSSFTPQYIDYNKLPAAEQKAQVDASNSGQVDDKFIDNNVFPIFNDRWQIDATVVNDSRSIILKVIFFEEVPDYDNGGAVKKVSDEVAEKYRREVLYEIKKRGANPDNYTIIYANEYLYGKYDEHPTH